MDKTKHPLSFLRFARKQIAKADGAGAASGGMDRMIARKPRWRRAAPWVVMAAILMGVAAWVWTGTGANVYRVPINRISIGTVSEGPFEEYIAVRGIVAPYTTAYLTTEQGGTVKQVLVEDGATVKQGQPLLILANPALQLQVAAQQLQFEQTHFAYQKDVLDIEHHVSELKNALVRDKTLLDGKAIAPSTYLQEQDDYSYYIKLLAATRASAAIEERVRATQLTGQSSGGNSPGDLTNAGVEALTIRAPMDGQLTALDAEVGQSKAQGAVLGQVNSADRFKLTADVDEFYLGRIAMGQEALFQVEGRNYVAAVSKIYPQVTNGTFKVGFYFKGDAPRDIHVGQAIDLKVQLGGATRAVMMPNGPYYQDTGGNWVFVLSPDGKYAVRQNVRLGRRNPDFVEIVDGLRPGDKVIVSGYTDFLKMDRVEFVNAASE